MNIPIININPYCAICKLKKLQIFAISIQDLKYHVEKKVRPKTNLSNIILEEYYNFLNIFSKKNIDILPSY